MTIRLLHVTATLDRSGSNKQLSLLAAGLPAGGFDVHVCCLARGGPLATELKERGISPSIVGQRHKFDPQAYSRLRRHIREVQPDIVHTWLFSANSYGRRAALACGARHIVASERCIDRWKRWYHWMIDRHLARRTDRLVANSACVRDFCIAKGLPAERFAVIANGIPVTQLQDNPATTTRDEILRELNLPPEARLIGAAGRLLPQKNYKRLFWAMCLLKEIRRDAHLLVFGEGPHRWRLERYRRQVQIEEHVHLLGERGDFDRFLPHLDLFASASGYEGQPVAIMETMAAGLPVVASDIPGHRDLVVPEETGYLVSLSDRAALARWMNVLLDDRNLARRLGAAGRERMREHFSVEKMVSTYADLYRSLGEDR